MDATIKQQRIQHIIDSYALAVRETAVFGEGLAVILSRYSFCLVEWALVDVLVQNWLRYPLPRGMAFLRQVEDCLRAWVNDGAISSALTPEQFQLITGLPVAAIVEETPLRHVSHQISGDIRKQ